MQKPEEPFLLSIKTKLWLRYFDDQFIIIKRFELERTFTVVNEIFMDVKFTRVTEHENRAVSICAGHMD